MTLTLKHDVQRHIVTSGDYGFAPAGQEVFSVINLGKPNKARINYNGSPGQLVAYTVNADGTTTTVDAGTLTAADLRDLYVGVFVDLDGDGVVDDIRHLGIESISGCNPQEAKASSPKCGTPKIVDFYFDCTKCDETYSLMVRVDDNKSRSFSPWNKSFAEFTGSIVTECNSCNDCPVEHNCREVACKLSDALNNELDLRVGERAYPDWKLEGLSRPFFATRLHANSYIYCLTLNTPEDSCENCVSVDAITGALVNGEAKTFTGTLNPADSTQTLRGQIQHVVDQLNEAFRDEYGDKAHAGSAYATWVGYSNCCDIELHVNTCDGAFELRTTGDAEITPTTEENPFTEYGTHTPDADCIDCGDQPSSTAYNCGIRVISEPLRGDCNCYVNKPLATYMRDIEVEPIGDGWKGKSWRVVEVQDMTPPSGFGSWIQWLELQTDVVGRARTYSRGNTNRTWQNLPDSQSRIKNAVSARCDTDYCSYYYKFHLDRKFLDGQYGVLVLHSNLHIPSNDAITVAAWEAFSDALLGFNPSCRTVGTVACTTGAQNMVVE